MAFAPACFATSATSRMQRAAARFLVFALGLLGADAHAQRSYFRMYDQDYGLDVGEIVALAQDRDGFLWIGSHRGLVRFDGRSFVLWDQDKVDEVVAQIAVGPDDELLLRTATARVFRRGARGLDPVTGPDGGPLNAVDSLDFDAAGNLWTLIDGQLWRRGHGAWSRVDHGIPRIEKLVRVIAAGNDPIVLTDVAAWRLHDGEPARRLLEAKDLWFAAGMPDGSLRLATHFGGGLWRIDSDGAHAFERPIGRALDMRQRNGTLWLALDRQLLAYAADGSMRLIGVAEGLPSGGPLLVDRENSLWLGTFVGLAQFPEPDTWQWGEAEGLPSIHAYAVT